jgi:hypothetical protein
MSLGLFFQSFDAQECCLCGEASKLTGEHKMKASALRDEFGKTELYVSKIGDAASRPKLAQSTQSKHLKFDVPICEACNTSRTQQADREFDNFNQLAHGLLRNGEDPVKVFESPRYHKDTKAYLNVSRYFAKILCCHMAEVRAPRPKRLSNFAIGKTDTNYVWLAVRKDWTYDQMREQIGDLQYAAHGGLIVYGDKTSGDANAFHSTLTIGPIQYVFFMRLGWVEKLELKVLFPDFTRWCRLQVKEAEQFPLPLEERMRHGLSE